MAKYRTYGSYDYNRDYNSTSEAYERYEAQPVAPIRKRVVRHKRRRGPQYEHALGSIIYPRFIYVVLSFVFVGCLLSVFVYSFAWSRTRSILNLQNEIKLVQENIAALEADSTFSYDLRKIEEIAKSRLQMSFPEQHQIVYIDVPKESYIEQYVQVNETEAQPKISGVVNDFFKELSNGASKKN